MDDYSYVFSFADQSQRIETISDIIPSQIAHYQTTNGRALTHSLAQFFLLIGKETFNVINATAFVVLLFLIYYHIYGTLHNVSIRNFMIIGILLFLSTPAFGESYLWLTGSSNYLYAPLIVLLFLIPYRHELNKTAKRPSVIANILMAICMGMFGVLAGWTNENNAIAMICVIVGYIIVFLQKKIQFKIWHFSGILGAIVGCMMMLLSPGMSYRLNEAGGFGSMASLVKRAIYASLDIVTYLHLLIILCIIFFLLYITQSSKITCGKHLIQNSIAKAAVPIVYFVGFLASVYCMIIPPQFPARAWSGPVIYSLIAVGSFGTLLDFTKKHTDYAKQAITIVAVMLFVSTYVNAFLVNRNVYIEYQSRQVIIENAIDRGEEVIEIPTIIGGSSYTCFRSIGDLKDDSSEWPNNDIAKYYGVEKIVLKR